jgi:tRNA threonylcarbamoyladenosine biosynthesis protein TsaB
MTVLGIDSATSTASAALVEEGKIIAEQRYPHAGEESRSVAKAVKAGHAEILVPLIESVLETTRGSFRALTGIAVSIGPGSFTGLRIGLSTVKGLAYGWDIPVVGISTLWANAARADDVNGVVCSILDARKQQVYAALFRRCASSLTRMTEDSVMSIDALIELAGAPAAAAPPLFIGDAVGRYHEALKNRFGNALWCTEGDPYRSIAAAAAQLAEHRLRVAEGDFLGTLVPVYLRPPEAESKRALFT